MAVEKSSGFSVVDLGFFFISVDDSTSMRAGASGMYVPVAQDMRRSALVSWKRRGKYCAVGIRRMAPRVTWTTG